jgi:hypothetical protein
MIQSVHKAIAQPLCPILGISEFSSYRFYDPSFNDNSFVPDPLHMAPLKVGDFLEYSYIEFNNELVCFAITANIGIYTAANVKPAFIRVEDALIGVIDTVNVDVEFARARVRLSGCLIHLVI